MNTILIAAIISGVISIAISILAHFFGVKRDSQSDWRKLKLETYKEYVLALSGIVHKGRATSAQRRYADAVNSLVLIAPPRVLEALYVFQDEITYRNPERTQDSYEILYSDLARAMRLDCHPTNPRDSSDFIFRTLDIPPEAESD